MGAKPSVAQPPRRTQSTAQTCPLAGAGVAGPSGVTDPMSLSGQYLGVSANGRHRSQSLGAFDSVNRSTRGGASGQDVDSDSSSEDFAGLLQLNRLLRMPGSTVLPPPAFRYFDFKCPMCNKTVPSDDIECHVVICLTRPKIIYNEDVLSEDKGECVICLEDLLQGDTIARLPCLCIYHKGCIDSWFKVKNSCPEHPGDY